jgi:hypothetical protein
MIDDVTKLLLDVAAAGTKSGATTEQVYETLKMVRDLALGEAVMVGPRAVAPETRKAVSGRTGRSWTPNSSRTGKIPYGYKRQPGPHGKLVVDKRQLAYIPQMFKLHKKGMSKTEIRDHIVAAMKRDKITTNLSVSTVYRILNGEHQFTRAA